MRLIAPPAIGAFVARRSWRSLAAPVVLGVLAVSVLAAQPSRGSDERYLIEAHRDHLAEIEAGRAAEQKGSTAAVRAQGRRLVADHTRLDDDVKRVATLLDVSLSNEPMRLRRAQLRGVTAESGRDFDQAWVAHEITTHRESLTEAQNEAANGTSPYVRVLAREAAPVLRAHLEMLEELRISAPARPSTVPAGLAGFVAAAPRDVGTTGATGSAGPARTTRPPVRLRMRAQRLDLPVRPVGLRRNGSLKIPKDPAVLGWWASGASPGGGGTIVVVGHIDNRRSGAGPFAKLRKVKLNTVVTVTTADGARIDYRVVGRRTYRHDRLPAGLFARSGPARLALVTCTGRYDRREGHHTQTLVVYAVPRPRGR